jgi:hypothetical protein
MSIVFVEKSKKWIKIILSIYYNNNFYYEQIKKLDKKITEKAALNILKKQIKYINKRNITIDYCKFGFLLIQ